MAEGDDVSWDWRGNYIRTFLERDIPELGIRVPPMCASWEGFAVEQLIRALGVPDEEAFFWGIHNQAELDLLVFGKGRRLGFEVKYTDTPRPTRSQHVALETLGLESITVVVPGDADYPLTERVRVLGLSRASSIH